MPSIKLPNGYIASGWSYPARAIDSDSSSYAYISIPPGLSKTYTATYTSGVYSAGIRFDDKGVAGAAVPTGVRYHKTDDNGQVAEWVTVSGITDSQTVVNFDPRLFIDKIEVTIYNKSDRHIITGDLKYIWFYAVNKPTLDTPTSSSVTGSTATLNGNIVAVDSETVTERGFQYKIGTAGSVTTASDKGSYSTGTFSKNLTELSAGTTYYFRAYATTLAGTTYTDWVGFTTNTVPTVTTTATPVAKDHESATLAGEVTDADGQNITRRGIEYKEGSTGTPLRVYEDSSDWGEDTFSLEIDELYPYTEYYFRAYAVNASGTGYGDWKTFTTDQHEPIVQTNICTNIQTTSVTANGYIAHKGGATVLTRGFCYKEGTTGDPTTADDTVSEGAGSGDYDTGSYSLSITGLTPSTPYLVRAYAVNSEGTGYGETILISGYSFTPNSETFFENFYDKCFIVNGVDDVMRYDGDIITKAGIEAPKNAPTGAGGGADGSLGVGNYYFKYTYVDADGYESNPSPASAAIDVKASEHVTVTVANSTDPKVVAKNIYRSLLGGGIYYYDGQIADNSTTTYISTKADTSLGERVTEDHDPPPKGCQLIAKKGNRLFLASDDDLCISHLSDIEYYPPAWFIKSGIRQHITGLTRQFNTLPLLTQNSLEHLHGTDEDNFELANSWTRTGCYAKRSAVVCEGLLIYLSYDGIYYYDGTSVKTFNRRLNKYLQENINPDYIDKAAGAYHKGLYLLSYPKGDSTVNSETVYIDLINGNTGIYDYAFHCYSKWDRQADGDKLMGGSTTEGRVYEIGNITTDDSSVVACYDETDFMDFGYPERYKQFYHLYIKIDNTDGDVLRFYYTLDDNDETYIEKDISVNTLKWYKIDLAGGGQRGRAIKLRPYIANTDNVKFCGYMVVFELDPKEYS